MGEVTVSQQNWGGGELSPQMRGRFELPVYQTGAERIVNFICETTGPARYRSGFQFVNPTRRNNIACLIPFQFNDTQAYQLEFTENYIRFYQNNDIITLPAVPITGATRANPIVITAAAHGYMNGDEVIISGILGMTQLNGRNFVVQNITTNTFQLYDTSGLNAINGTGYTAYSSGGISEKIYEVPTPYLTADLFQLKYAPNADTMYIVHKSYPPMKLVRSGTTSWAINTFVRSGDPFTGPGFYPGAVCFYQGRLVYGYSAAYPQSFWGSKPLDTSGNPQYDDLTVGTNPTDAYKFTLAPVAGKVDYIQSLVPTLNFLAICTLEGIFKCDGGAAGDPISPSTVDITPAVTQGTVQQITPILLGVNLIFFHRSALIMYSLEYDIFFSAYNASDKNLSNEHITESGAVQMVYRNGRPPMFLYPRNDGVLIGVTWMGKENINGAHRHIMGGTNSKVLSVGIMPRAIAFDQIWAVVERTVNGQTVRYVEYANDEVVFPEADDAFNFDYVNEEADQTADQDVWLNKMFEAQKQYVFLDSALTYDGSDYATGTLTPGAVTGVGVTFTASTNIFTASMVGRELWKKSINGIGSGRAQITAYVSATQVTCTILKDFDSVTAMGIGNWYLTTDTINGLWHLEGETIGILTDGAEAAIQTVLNGAASVQFQSSVIHGGLNYLGFIRGMAIEAGGVEGPAQGKPKNINRLAIHFLNTLGAKYGSSIYNLQEVDFRNNNDSTGRPSPLFTGTERLQFTDATEVEKHLYIVQTRPLPCTVLCVTPSVDTDNE